MQPQQSDRITKEKKKKALQKAYFLGWKQYTLRKEKQNEDRWM